jgi:hypothetical protein
LIGLVDKTPLGKGNPYADNAWFKDQESACETVLAKILSEVGARDPRAPAPNARCGRSRGGIVRSITNGHHLVGQIH